MPNPLQPVIDAMYGADQHAAPYLYPKSPYGLGDLVPGNMPTRFGPLQPIPEASALLAAHAPASQPFEYFSQSPERGAGQAPAVAAAGRQPLPVNLDTRPAAGLPINGQRLMRPMPSLSYPRPDRTASPEGSLSVACWIQENPILAAGVAGLVYYLLSGSKKRGTS